MSSSVSNPPIPSEFDDEVDDDVLPPRHIWAYPCKLPSCPDYGRSWTLRSNFLFHLHEQEAHGSSATTPTARRAIEIEWRYATDPHLPPRTDPGFRSREHPDEHIWNYSFKDGSGKVISDRGTRRQIEMHRASRRLEAEGTPDEVPVDVHDN
jgi:hypothetical protein